MPTTADVLNRIADMVREATDDERRRFAEQLARTLRLPTRRVEQALVESTAQFLTVEQFDEWQHLQMEMMAHGNEIPDDVRLQDAEPLGPIDWPALLCAPRTAAPDGRGGHLPAFFGLDVPDTHLFPRAAKAQPIDWLEPGVHDVLLYVVLFQTALEARQFRDGWTAADLTMTGGGHVVRTPQGHAAVVWKPSRTNTIVWKDARQPGALRTLAIVGPNGRTMTEEEFAEHLDATAA